MHDGLACFCGVQASGNRSNQSGTFAAAIVTQPVAEGVLRQGLGVMIETRGKGGMQSVQAAGDGDGCARPGHPVEEGRHWHCHHQGRSLRKEDADVDQDGSDFFFQVLEHQSFLTFW